MILKINVVPLSVINNSFMEVIEVSFCIKLGLSMNTGSLIKTIGSEGKVGVLL